MHSKQMLKHGTLSLAYLRSLPTFSEGQADNLKIDRDGVRVWLSRCSKADGEPYDNKVTVEVLRDGRWQEFRTYPAGK